MPSAWGQWLPLDLPHGDFVFAGRDEDRPWRREGTPALLTAWPSRYTPDRTPWSVSQRSREVSPDALELSQQGRRQRRGLGCVRTGGRGEDVRLDVKRKAEK